MFITMALTGLSLLWGRVALIPIFGHTVMSGYLGASKVLHNYLGPLLLVGIFLEFVVWVRHNIPKKFDLEWLKRLGRPARRQAAAPCGEDQRGRKGMVLG